jgi:hypothetical protein
LASNSLCLCGQVLNTHETSTVSHVRPGPLTGPGLSPIRPFQLALRAQELESTGNAIQRRTVSAGRARADTAAMDRQMGRATQGRGRGTRYSYESNVNAGQNAFVSSPATPTQIRFTLAILPCHVSLLLTFTSLDS